MPNCKSYYDEEDNWSMASSYPMFELVFFLLLSFVDSFQCCSSRFVMEFP